MKKIHILLLLFFIIGSLDASYLRTIRVGSFLSEGEAKEALVSLEEFMVAQENVVKLQKEHRFEYRYRKSGDYYITLVEPLTQREVLQEVLDTLRKNYPDVYVTKLSLDEEKKYLAETAKSIKTEKTVKNEKPVVVQNETLKTQEQLENIIEKKKVEHMPADAVEENISEDTKNVSAKEVLFEHSDAAQEDLNPSFWTSEYILEILFIVSFLINILFFRFLFVYKRELESFTTQEMIYEAKIDKHKLEIQNKEKLIYQVSHELRTPMTAIMGLSHIILNTELNKSQRDNLKRIESSAEYLLSILNDILDMSKIQAGELRLENLEFNINGVLDNAFNTIALDAKNKKIDISMNIDKNVPSHIIGDSLRLRQILINLLGNGVKFTKKGGVSLKIKKVSESFNSVKLEFIVSDTGIGMTSSQIENLFKSFTQADISISREYGGTGLGLAISKQLIDMMHGDIRVESKKDSGTSFIFSLTFSIKDANNKRQYRLPSANLMKKRVLLIEPENDRAISIKNMLAYFHYNTHIIPSFEKSVMDTSIVFDIVIINELSLNRYAVDKIEELRKKHNAKTVLLTELHSEMNNSLIKDIEIDSYLQRPFNQQSMLNMIVDLYEIKNLDALSKKAMDKDILKLVSGKKILVAEDNKINQKVIAGLLLDTGIELFFVDNGQEAVEFLKQDSLIDLILMDINMPIMNGHEASKEIRKNIQYNTIPIIALTADVMEKAIQDAMLSGMQGHISKPIIVDIFYKKLFDVLSQDLKKNKAVDAKSVSFMPESKNEFEELSISVGLERCNNDKDFYKSLLEEFKKMYKNSPELLNLMYVDGNFQEARRIAMDIKDVALNIGAYNLCESAAALEYEFEKGARGNGDKLIDFYADNLAKLFKDIDKYIEKFC
jgi:signal transduction histidine kinase/DNA-binding response OmpR family regulator